MKRLEYSHQWIELGNNVSEKILFKTRIWFKPDVHNIVHRIEKRVPSVIILLQEWFCEKTAWRLTSVQFWKTPPKWGPFRQRAVEPLHIVQSVYQMAHSKGKWLLCAFREIQV